MKLGIFILILCVAGTAFSAWRIWRLRRLKPPPPDGRETIGQLNDRMERDFEEIFRKWEQ